MRCLGAKLEKEERYSMLKESGIMMALALATFACDVESDGGEVSYSREGEFADCEDCRRNLCHTEETACWEDGYVNGCAAILACRLGSLWDCQQSPDQEALDLIGALNSCEVLSCSGYEEIGTCGAGYDTCHECAQFLCEGDMADQPCLNSQCGGYCELVVLPTCEGSPSMECVQCLGTVRDESEPFCEEVAECAALAECVEGGTPEADCVAALNPTPETAYLHQAWQGARSVCEYWGGC